MRKILTDVKTHNIFLLGFVLTCMIVSACSAGSSNMDAHVTAFGSDQKNCITVTMSYQAFDYYNGVYCRANLVIP